MHKEETLLYSTLAETCSDCGADVMLAYCFLSTLESPYFDRAIIRGGRQTVPGNMPHTFFE